MRLFTLIFLGIVGYSAYLIITMLFFGDNNLALIERTRPSYVTTYVLKEANNKVAYLGFMFKEDRRMFTIAADIAHVPDGERIFDGVANALKEAGEVKILIRKGEIAIAKPKVYVIKADERNIFELSKKPNNSDLMLLLLLLLLLLCSGYYWLYGLAITKKKPTYQNKWAF